MLPADDAVLWKSFRNIPRVHVVRASDLNTYDVLCADDIVFTQAALDAFVEVATKGAKAAKEDAK